MSKIVPFRTHTDNVLEFLDEVKEGIEENKIENVLIGCKSSDGDVMVGFTKNLDYGEMQEIISHLQTNLILRMLKEGDV
jgi:hypothetical protein